jgi:hypothetical protein
MIAMLPKGGNVVGTGLIGVVQMQILKARFPVSPWQPGILRRNAGRAGL